MMQLMNQKEQLEAKISESKSINEANLLKLREEIEEDGKPCFNLLNMNRFYFAFIEKTTSKS